MSRCGVELYVVQHRFLRHIAKVHVIENDCALQRDIVGDIGILVIMRPCPKTGAGGGSGERSVGMLFGTGQRDIALVGLRCLVKQRKHSFRTRQRHDDAVDLHGDLVDGLAEALVEGEEAGKSAERQSRHTAQRQSAADDGAQHIA